MDIYTDVTNKQNKMPRIAILMAVYNPRLDWFVEQLRSLDAQTYPNLCLFVRDDCSTRIGLAEIERIVGENIKSFPFTVSRSEKNGGSNDAFEKLTAEADGDYFAYCDQDDVWLPEKLNVLQREIENTGAELICSDMFIIDGQGNKTAESITDIRRHHIFHSGEGLAKKLIVSSWVTGCTMLVRAKSAKKAIPFCPYMVHDQYIALSCAENGRIVSLPDKLINYRIHNGNQTPMMAGVTDRESYFKCRIELMKNRAEWLRDNFVCSNELQSTIGDCCAWAQAREKHWQRKGGIRDILRYRSFSLLTSLFESCITYLPDFVFDAVIKLKKNNMI